ncbi:MAG: TIGR00282 family metallophosphoesterase [Candidatus Cloacimonetes bacterium]|nr:TIGR00282 family metallophosphoesterase [Candidatus Cloacimonadota bacterium]
MNLLFIGDVFGKPGREVIKRKLPQLKNLHNIDIVIANCENLASGKGVTTGTANELFNSGVDILTGGNHLWDRKEGYEFIANDERVVKPLNYPPDSIGNLVGYVNFENSIVAVLSMTGQSFMPPCESPILSLRKVLEEVVLKTNIIIVDFHAESTAEKRAIGQYFDGQVTAILGTHTHIQTADEEILPGGTAYITDTGMTGPHDSVIGVKKEIIFKKMITGMPINYEIAETGLQLNAVKVEINIETGKAFKITRIRENLIK